PPPPPIDPFAPPPPPEAAPVDALAAPLPPELPPPPAPAPEPVAFEAPAPELPPPPAPEAVDVVAVDPSAMPTQPVLLDTPHPDAEPVQAVTASLQQPAPDWDVAEAPADGPQQWSLHTTPMPLEPAPVVPPGPAPAAAPAPGPDPLAVVNSVDVPQPAFDAANQAVSGEMPAVPAEIPHLASPENLPTGTTLDQVAATGGDSPNVTYLKDLWHAIQTQDITGKDALLALTQRPLTTPAGPENLNAPGVPPGPAGDVPPAPLGAEGPVADPGAAVPALPLPAS
ncbi:MAG TPA: transglycosylase, partial [Mycobacterium sp.]|nr:transglycosylase [Mycobacterium sp.]